MTILRCTAKLAEALLVQLLVNPPQPSNQLSECR